LAGRGPVPLKALFGEIDEGAGNIRVVGDELPIEVGEAEERAYVFDLGGGRPLGDSVELDGVHSELPQFDDHPEIFYLISGEFAFFKFEVQVEFCHALQDTFGAFLV